MLMAHPSVVHIAEPEMAFSEEPSLKKQFTAGMGKRLSGRSPLLPSSSSRASLVSQGSFEGPSPVAMTASPALIPEDSGSHPSHHLHHHHHHKVDRASEILLAKVAEWIQHEKVKKAGRRTRKVLHHRRKSKSPPIENGDAPPPEAGRQRRLSVDSDSSEVSLDRLQRILDDGMSALGLDSLPGFSPRRRSSTHQRKGRGSLQLTRTASSDTDFVDGDVLVPSCDAVLDNSRTMSYSGGRAASDASSISSRREEKEKQAWARFKNEIIRLAHTLRLKGWRRVPLDTGDTIWVERLSGALTNAVYVVSPPAELANAPSDGKRRPRKLLLRIYGPQVEHLIDRENELSVLQRLARKRIGPRLLGTFTNGRFEEFYNATTLTCSNLREPETSKQIAKPMREVHDGIELLEDELDDGPGVWKNWDRWHDAVERIITHLDKVVLSEGRGSGRRASEAWKAKGFICGVEWPKFKAAIDKYRDFLDRYYGDRRSIRERLVFCHNDVSIDVACVCIS